MYRLAMETKIGIPCSMHEVEICPECHNCDCGASTQSPPVKSVRLPLTWRGALGESPSLHAARRAQR
jgi:hypothetical protein